MTDTVLGAQMFTLREYTKTPKDIAKTLAKVKEIGYDAIQASAFGPIEPRELKKIIDDTGITIAATHASYDRMKDEPEKVIEEHQLWGCEHTAIGMVPDAYMSEEGYAQFAREASEVARKLQENGLSFSYHNHGFELEPHSNGKTGLQILMENSDPDVFNFEIDTYWIQFGGGDPAQWIEKAKGRMPLVHLKDMIGKGWEQTMAEVGEGNLNWPRILDACKAAGVQWYLVEQDICHRDPYESLKISLDNLHQMGLK